MNTSKKDLVLQFLGWKRTKLPDSKTAIMGYQEINGQYFCIIGSDQRIIQEKPYHNPGYIGLFTIDASKDYKQEDTETNFVCRNGKMEVQEWDTFSNYGPEMQSALVENILNYAYNGHQKQVSANFQKDNYTLEMGAQFDATGFSPAALFGGKVYRSLDVDPGKHMLLKNTLLLKRMQVDGIEYQILETPINKYGVILKIKRGRVTCAELKLDCRWNVGRMQANIMEPVCNDPVFLFPLSVYTVIAAINRNCQMLELAWAGQSWQVIEYVVQSLDKLGGIMSLARKLICLDLSLSQVDHWFSKAPEDCGEKGKTLDYIDLIDSLIPRNDFFVKLNEVDNQHLNKDIDVRMAAANRYIQKANLEVFRLTTGIFYQRHHTVKVIATCIGGFMLICVTSDGLDLTAGNHTACRCWMFDMSGHCVGGVTVKIDNATKEGFIADCQHCNNKFMELKFQEFISKIEVDKSVKIYKAIEQQEA